MATSIVNIQRDIILNTIRYTVGDEWKVLVVDEISRKLINGATNEDDILNLNVTNVEQIEHKRPTNADMDALYILSPLPHIVDCLMADLERKRYRKSWLVWTSFLDSQQRTRLSRSQMAQDQIADTRVMNINYYPKESRLVTFRDPWSFPVLFHPSCNHLIRTHLEDIAQKVVSLCASLGEYPVIRYYKPRTPTHEASVLCSHLARFIQNEIDQFAQFQRDFPPPSPRPRGILLVVDRSMDLVSPLLHEFTYQAMVHDLLPVKDGDKVTYRTVLNEGSQNEETKDMEITELDKVWVEYRHLHMKDVLGKLGEDFAKFRAANPQFAENESASVNTIKDMLAGLTEFQEGRNAYTLHLNMAQECMRHFQDRKLLEVSSVEQCLATGLDENYKKAKNLASQIVQLLDNESVTHPDRLRLLLLYVMYRGGLLPGDIRKLMAHAQLPPQDSEVVYNMELLGARVEKLLRDEKPPTQPLFNRKPPTPSDSDEANLSRYDLSVKLMLEELIRGTLDPSVFPSTRPHTDTDGAVIQDGLSQASLRSAKPTWARTRSSADHARQRIIVFMAGGATYGEARSCYEVSQMFGKDVFLATSHMLSPGLFLRQLGDLSVDKRRLDIPAERPKPKAPAHLFERETPPPQPQPAPKPQAPMPRLNPPAPPAAAMGAMSLGPDASRAPNGSAPAAPTAPAPSGKLYKKDKEKKDKDKDKDKDKKEKKRHHFFR